MYGGLLSEPNSSFAKSRGMLIQGLGVRPQVRSHKVCTQVVVWS